MSHISYMRRTCPKGGIAESIAFLRAHHTRRGGTPATGRGKYSPKKHFVGGGPGPPPTQTIDESPHNAPTCGGDCGGVSHSRKQAAVRNCRF